MCAATVSWLLARLARTLRLAARRALTALLAHARGAKARARAGTAPMASTQLALQLCAPSAQLARSRLLTRPHASRVLMAAHQLLAASVLLAPSAGHQLVARRAHAAWLARTRTTRCRHCRVTRVRTALCLTTRRWRALCALPISTLMLTRLRACHVPLACPQPLALPSARRAQLAHTSTPRLDHASRVLLARTRRMLAQHHARAALVARGLMLVLQRVNGVMCAMLAAFRTRCTRHA